MQLLVPLIGKKVTVFTVQADTERQDIGILEAAEGNFVVIRKSDHEVLYFSLSRLRLIKPFEPH
jgi:hypothetical protein